MANPISSLRYAVISCLLPLVGCGGGGGSTPVEIVPPVPVADFSSIIAEIDRHPIENMAIMIGTDSEVLLSYEKGNFEVDTSIPIASASKLLTGLAVWSLIENGSLAAESKAADIIADWPQTGEIADVDLSQLLSFTSGFNLTPSEDTCAGDILRSLNACVLEIVDGGIDTAPGTAFAYGPEHMQIAALMARNATGKELFETLRDNILDPVNVSDETGFFTGQNTRYSGFARSTTTDYGLVLQGLLSGTVVDDLPGFLTDRTSGADVFFSPTDVDLTGLDWRYGFGFWIECDLVPFNQSCNDTPMISSAGAFGFVPWIDFKNGYWAIISMQESGRAIGSTELQQVLQPMIEAIIVP